MPDKQMPAGFIPDGFEPDKPATAPPSRAQQPPKPSGGWTNTVASALPVAGGILGGARFGPAGAAIGGAVGHGYKQLIQNGAEIPGAVRDVASNLLSHPAAIAEGASKGMTSGGINTAAESVMQAGGQKAGDALAAGASVMSKWLMNRATSRVSAKLMQDFPGLNETLIDNALTVSKGGYSKAYAMLMTAKAKANAALKAADDTGDRIPIQWTPDLAESFKTAILEKAVKSGAIPPLQPGAALNVVTKRLDPRTQRLFELVDDAATSGATGHIAPTQADLLKTQLQKESKALYANRNAPNGPKAMGMDATERGEFASRLNDAIDAVAHGYKAANAEARPLIGAVRGLTQATRPSGNLYQAMVRPAVGAALGGAAGSREGGPGSLIGGAAGMYAMSPKGMSQGAIILANPAIQGAIRALPKPAAAWLTDLLSTQLEESPPQGPIR